MSLSNQQIQELKADLLEMKKSLEKPVKEPVDSDELTVVDHHLADAADGLVDREEKMAEEALRRKRLLEVEEALERMEKGTYGICADSGEAIPFERLKAVPYAKRTAKAEEARRERSRAEADTGTGRGPTSRLERSEGETEDERMRTLERLEEEHERRERPEDFEEENRW